MKLSKIAEFFLSLCWKDEEIRATTFVLNDTYVLDGVKYILNEELLNELINYQEHSTRTYSVVRMGNDKVVNLTGKRIKH